MHPTPRSVFGHTANVVQWLLILALVGYVVYDLATPPVPSTPQEWTRIVYGDETYFYASAAVEIGESGGNPTWEWETTRERACIVGEAQVRAEAQNIVYRVVRSLLAYPPPEFPFDGDLDVAAASVWEGMQAVLPIPIYVPITTHDDQEGVLVVFPLPRRLLAQQIAEVWTAHGAPPPHNALRLAVDRLDPRGAVQ